MAFGSLHRVTQGHGLSLAVQTAVRWVQSQLSCPPVWSISAQAVWPPDDPATGRRVLSTPGDDRGQLSVCLEAPMTVSGRGCRGVSGVLRRVKERS